MLFCFLLFCFFVKQKTAYEMRISDGSSDVCSSDLDTKGGSTALQSQFVGLPIGGIPVNELDADRTDLPFVTNVIGQLDEWLVAGSLKVDYDMGWATLTSVTAADKLYQFFGGDSPPYLADSGTPGSKVQNRKRPRL